jgi:hypothetical protein
LPEIKREAKLFWRLNRRKLIELAEKSNNNPIAGQCNSMYSKRLRPTDSREKMSNLLSLKSWEQSLEVK